MRLACNFETAADVFSGREAWGGSGVTGCSISGAARKLDRLSCDSCDSSILFRRNVAMSADLFV